jgi:hypothetical protein
MVTFIAAGAARLAPSRAEKVTLTLPPPTVEAVTASVQDRVVVPHVEGATVNPGDPAETIEAGINRESLLVTVKCRGPVPVTVKG